MNALLSHFMPIIALLQRYPGTVAIFAFISGVASFILVDRQAPLAKVLGVILVLSWLWLILENLLRTRIKQRFGFEIPLPALRYVTQMIHQESLFFVLPFFYITTTWDSPQLLFFALLATAALVSIIDPLYFRWLAPRRWLLLIMHSLALFAVALTALPIIFHLSTAQTYQIALSIAMLLTLPSLPSLIQGSGWRRLAVLAVVPVILAAAGWYGRLWVPPATLWLTEMAITDQFNNRKRIPGTTVEEISVADLKKKGLYAYTAINAPRGLKERIYHEWRHNGRVIERIALDINGGREQGYRAWTHKRNFPRNPQGNWQVRVLSESGQMVGELRFSVVEPAA